MRCTTLQIRSQNEGWGERNRERLTVPDPLPPISAPLKVPLAGLSSAFVPALS
ncbi:hypothetical protein RCH23_003095 [Cryobacterium sp. CAN_C3]|nr:hypothetical protein [Cryobacterium sp. CAN_C3]